MIADTEPDPRRARKSETAFRTISEVSDDLDVPQHVLRFWEGKFSQIRPLKRGGGRRYYRPEDLLLLRRIRDLLYREGYTIRGVQKLLRDGVADPDEPAGAPAPAPASPDTRPDLAASAGAATHRETLREIMAELGLLRDLLARARGHR